MNKLIRKNDILLVAAFLLCAGLSALAYFLFFGETGSLVRITVDGNFYADYPLAEDTSVEISGTNGIDILQIKDGFAQMLQADCPDLICVLHKPISRTGESIICLPNRIVVEIIGTGDAPVIDSISQ